MSKQGNSGYDYSHMKTNSPAQPQESRVNQAPVIAGVQPVLRRLSAGSPLLRQGDKSIGMFFLTTGRLRMQRVTPDGGMVTLHVVRPGETFAEASLFADSYQCDIIAESDAEVWLYPKGDLTRRLRENPDSLWELTAGLARSLHGMRLRYELKQIRSAPERILQFLRLRDDGTGVYRATGTLKEMATELGLTHEALYRALATLERQKHIRRDDVGLRIMSKRRNDSAQTPENAD
jgi:CRP/FNR family transcriptional regulator, dissimilatory nitrate respiration regulator